MRNKIMIMVLLCALLVGLVPPGSARAEDVGYAFNEWCEDNGLVCGKASDEDWSSADVHFSYDSSCIYIVTQGGSDFYLTKVMASVDDIGLYLYSKSNKVYAKSLSTSKAFSKYVYKYSNDGWHFLSSASPTLSTSQFTSFITDVSQSSVVYTNVSLYSDESLSGVPLVSVTEKPFAPYSFYNWCSDAGLNCAPSSNDLGLIKYGYEEYMHIVRRTGTDKYGRWILTTIGNSVYADNVEDYTVMVDENGQLGVYCLYSGEDVKGYQLFVRNYVYDTDGWRLMSYELFDTREDDDYIIELGEDSSINDYSLLAYSGVDIYSTSLNLTYPASTEFVDVNDVLPDVPEEPEEPIITPTVPPSSGATGLILYRPEMLGKIVSSFASMYDVPNGADEDIILDLLQGMDVTVHGWLSDASGKVWYYCTYKNVYEDKVSLFTGYIDSAKVGLSNGADVDSGEDLTLREKIMEITAFVGSVPLIIGALFSFLPPWCLTLTAIGFGILVIIMIRRGTLG